MVNSENHEMIEEVGIQTKKHENLTFLLDFLFKNIIGVGSILLVVIGILKISYFYLQFNIDITDYIAFTEIFTLYLLDAVYLAVYTISIYGIIFFIQSNLDDTNEPIRVHIISKIILILLTVIAGGLSLYTYYYDYPMYIKFRHTCIPPVLMLLTAFLPEFIDLNSFQYKRLFHFVNVIYILVFILVIRTDSNVAELKYNSSKREYQFKYEDQLVKTNGRMVFLGQTAQYIFLYNQVNKVSYVYEKSKITSLTIRSNPNAKYLKFQ